MRPARRRLLIGLPLFLLTMLVVTLWPVLRLFLHSPKITRNYLAELERPALETPEADRGWSLYLKALESMGPVPDDELWKKAFDDHNPVRPGSPHWEEARTYILDRATALEWIRQAASRPRHAAPLSVGITPEHLAALRVRQPDVAFEPAPVRPENPPLIDVALPFLGDFRNFTRHLSLDTEVAADRNDPDRVAADIVAMCGIARHARETGFIIADLVGVSVAARAADVTISLLNRRPDLLREHHLEVIQAALAGLDNGALRFDARGERMFMADALQRTYSDDGAGDGRLTAEGLRHIAAIAGTGDSGSPPLTVAVVAAYRDPGRRAVRDTYDAVMDAAEAEAAKPYWRADLDALAERTSEATAGNRSLLLGILMPSLDKAVRSHLRIRHTRDAVTAALALHRYKCATGRWPATLDDLIPAYLAAVPLDMFTGDPLRYAPPPAENPGALPLLYSVGSDKDDDGGRRVMTSTDKNGRNAGPFDPTRTYDADWVFLGPEPPPEHPPED